MQKFITHWCALNGPCISPFPRLREHCRSVGRNTVITKEDGEVCHKKTSGHNMAISCMNSAAVVTCTTLGPQTFHHGREKGSWGSTLPLGTQLTVLEERTSLPSVVWPLITCSCSRKKTSHSWSRSQPCLKSVGHMEVWKGHVGKKGFSGGGRGDEMGQWGWNSCNSLSTRVKLREFKK